MTASKSRKSPNTTQDLTAKAGTTKPTGISVSAMTDVTIDVQNWSESVVSCRPEKLTPVSSIMLTSVNWPRSVASRWPGSMTLDSSVMLTRANWPQSVKSHWPESLDLGQRHIGHVSTELSQSRQVKEKNLLVSEFNWISELQQFLTSDNPLVTATQRWLLRLGCHKRLHGCQDTHNRLMTDLAQLDSAELVHCQVLLCTCSLSSCIHISRSSKEWIGNVFHNAQLALEL